MKRIIALSIVSLICSFLPAIASANPSSLPPQMDGVGIFTFKSTVAAAANKSSAKAYVKDLKAKGFSFAMIKSHDGGSWGTIVDKKWRPAISKELIDAFHAEGMRAYGYFTVRATNDSSIEKSIELSANVLDMGADGIIADDLGISGNDPVMWEKLFKGLRREVDKRKGKILASSTHPHLMNMKERLWGIAFQYSDYFLPQEYWMEFIAHENGKRVKMQPQNALAYGQAQFDVILARYPKSHCKLIPIGRTYGGTTDTKQIARFLNTASSFYHGAGLFVIEKEPKGGWGGIKKALTDFYSNRRVTSLSAFDRCNNGPCDDTTNEKIAKELIEKEKKPKMIKNKNRPKKKSGRSLYKIPSL